MTDEDGFAGFRGLCGGHLCGKWDDCVTGSFCQGVDSSTVSHRGKLLCGLKRGTTSSSNGSSSSSSSGSRTSGSSSTCRIFL